MDVSLLMIKLPGMIQISHVTNILTIKSLPIVLYLILFLSKNLKQIKLY